MKLLHDSDFQQLRSIAVSPVLEKAQRRFDKKLNTSGS